MQRVRYASQLYLPYNHLIYDDLLLCTSSTEIYACGLYTLVPHQIRKQRDIVILFKKVLSKSVAKRMRIYNFFIKSILQSIVLQLLCYTSCSDSLSESIEEKIPACSVLMTQPLNSFFS